MKSRWTILWLVSIGASFAAGHSLPGAFTTSPSAGISAAARVEGASVERAIPEGLGPEERRDIEVFRRATASVVYITSIALRRNFFSLDVMRIPSGTGSGFVWDTDGHIVTNFHVIEGGNAFSVTLADHSSWEARVVGTAPNQDLAVLRIGAPADRLAPLKLGRSHDLVVGQKVLALGNPFGLDHSLTVGVVSALGRELRSPGGRTIYDVIQTDAAINPGNSGGPLLDSNGRLVGVSSAIYSPSGAFAGIGFAVPVDAVARLVPQLIEHGRPIQPDIGVVWLSDGVAERLGLEGAVIYEVIDGSPAAKAGLEGIRAGGWNRILIGDRVVAVDGKPLRSADEILHVFEAAGVGARLTLTVERHGKLRDVRVVLFQGG